VSVSAATPLQEVAFSVAVTEILDLGPRARGSTSASLRVVSRAPGDTGRHLAGNPDRAEWELDFLHRARHEPVNRQLAVDVTFGGFNCSQLADPGSGPP